MLMGKRIVFIRTQVRRYFFCLFVVFFFAFIEDTSSNKVNILFYVFESNDTNLINDSNDVII